MELATVDQSAIPCYHAEFEAPCSLLQRIMLLVIYIYSMYRYMYTCNVYRLTKVNVLMHTVYKPVHVQLLKLHMPIPQIPSLVPRLPPLARNYCVTFKLALARKNGEFKGHAIIARKGGGSLGTRLPYTLRLVLIAGI